MTDYVVKSCKSDQGTSELKKRDKKIYWDKPMSILLVQLSYVQKKFKN